MRKVAAKCDIAPTVVLYFYSNEGDCPDCKRQGYVLTKLGDDFDELRIYAFDANLDLSALKTLVSINKVGSELPALVVDGETYSGFKSLNEMREMLPELVEEAEEAAEIDDIQN